MLYNPAVITLHSPAAAASHRLSASHLLQPRLQHQLSRVDPLLHRLAPLVGDAATPRHHLHEWAEVGRRLQMKQLGAEACASLQAQSILNV